MTVPNFQSPEPHAAENFRMQSLVRYGVLRIARLSPDRTVTPTESRDRWRQLLLGGGDDGTLECRGRGGSRTAVQGRPPLRRGGQGLLQLR